MYAFLISLGVLAVALVVCAGSLYALVKQKIVVDSEGHVSDIEIPLLGKLRTNYPSLIGLFIGAGVAVAVLAQWSAEPERMPLKASITVEDGSGGTSASRDVFIGVVPPNHYRTEKIPPNQLHTVQFPINGSGPGVGSHFAVVYTVVGIDKYGYAQRVVDSGSIRSEPGSPYAEFSARLRLPPQ